MHKVYSRLFESSHACDLFFCFFVYGYGGGGGVYSYQKFSIFQDLCHFVKKVLKLLIYIFLLFMILN